MIYVDMVLPWSYTSDQGNAITGMKKGTPKMSITESAFNILLEQQDALAAKIEKGKQAQVNVAGGVGFMAMYHSSPEEFERLTGDIESGQHLTPVEKLTVRKDYYEARQVIDVEVSR